MPSSLSPDHKPADAAPLRVLIVDDSLDAAHTLGRLLRLLGYDVETALDGPAALDRAEQFAPQIVVFDLGLPGMSGFEVARQLRAQAATAKALIVALSGYGHASARDEALAAGCNHHLLKPASIEQLQTIFQEVQ